VELLFEKNPGNELEGTVRREMKRIEDIVSEVLKFSRNTAPRLQPTSIHTVLDRTLKLVRPQFEGRNITLVTRFAASPDTVQGDENHLEQAFINLLLNAAEAMPGDGTITLETDVVAGDGAVGAQHNRQLRVLIRDSGDGISSENLAHLFEPFFTTKKSGTGLGLAITRRIIHEHHGSIRAESEPGKGAAFHIYLPAQ
jgi:signal transduction histidine kinase